MLKGQIPIDSAGAGLKLFLHVYRASSFSQSFQAHSFLRHTANRAQYRHADFQERLHAWGGVDDVSWSLHLTEVVQPFPHVRAWLAAQLFTRYYDK